MTTTSKTAVGGHAVKAVAALRLQRERSTVYQDWTALFHRAIIGDITSTELQRNIQGIVLPEFQRISTQLRKLQTELTETPPHNFSSSSNTEDPCCSADNKCRKNSAPVSAAPLVSNPSALAAWIDSLQDLEREHYAVTLCLANNLVEHCAPNVCVTPESELSREGDARKEDGGLVGVGAQRDRGKPTGMQALFKPDSSEDDEQHESLERPPVHIDQSTPTTSTQNPAPAPPTVCVHDVERCALVRLIPPRYAAFFRFVVCHWSLDDGDNTSGHPTNQQDSCVQEEDVSVDKELVSLPATTARRGGVSTIARYAPSDVASRCAEWSSAVASIVRHQESLRAAIEELCEELQAEISDSV